MSIGFMPPPRRLAVAVAALSALLLLAVFSALSLGTVSVDLCGLFLSLFNAPAAGGHDLSTDSQIVFSLRLPRVLLAGIVGATLSIGGAVFQTLFRNPLAEPYILGVSGGAATGAVISIALFAYTFPAGVAGGAFLGALLATVMILAVAALSRGDAPPENVILSGVVINAFFSAVIVFVISTSSASQMQAMTFWLMGNIPFADYADILPLFLTFIVCAAIVYGQARPLNALSLGEEAALQLGISPRRVRGIVITFVSLAIGAGVSLSGIIGFVGIIVPHCVKMLLGHDNRVVIVASALLGASFLILADMVSRVLIAPAELPIGVVTAMIGAPFFAFLLWRRRRC